jgi:curved DNA-binding protein CbpA
MNPDSGSVFELLAALRRRRASGLLELVAGEQPRRLHLREGDLWLPGGHPLGRQLAQSLDSLERSPSQSVRDALLELVSRIAGHLFGWDAGASRLVEGLAALPADLVGPLPTARLLMVGSVIGVEPADLERRLEGLGTRIRGVERPAAFIDALGFHPEEQYLLERLRRPMPIGDLLDGNPFPREAAVRHLAQLQWLGVVVPESAPGPQGAGRPEVVAGLAERIARSLTDRPLSIALEAHRERAVDLIARHGGLDHYELLGIESAATVEEIHAGYEDLARLVHPSHAARLELAGGESALRRLFARATEAYETLLDPELRRRYNARQMIEVQPDAVDQDRRAAEVRDLARGQFERAVAYAAAGDPHNAILLLEQAVKVDPRAEYWWTLARQQARNPNWQRRAIESYRQALLLDPHNVEVRLESGRLYQECGDPERARAQYAAVLRSAPGHAEATARLAGLGAAGEAEKKESKGFLARLFRRA